MNILYVEDDARDADLVRRELKKTTPQFALEVVASLEHARQRLMIVPLAYDLVLIDMRLLDGYGLDLLGHIRAQNLPLAVVVITGSGNEEVVVTALRAGADDYVVKSGDYLQRLPVTLRSALEHFRVSIARRNRPLRVLHAEHHAVDIDLVRRHFARHAPHLHAEPVHTGAQVLDRLPEHGPLSNYDLLLLDYRLPGMSGLELLKEVLQTRALDLPVVIVTGQGDEEVAAQALKLGAADYLVKGADYLQRLPVVLENAYFRAELVREQAALRASENRFRTLFEQSPFSIQVFAPDGRTLQVNRAWETLWGVKLYALSGYDILHDQQLAAKGVAPYIERGFAGEAVEIPPIVYNPQETTEVPGGPFNDRWVRAFIYPIKDDTGHVREVILMHEDVTERRRINEAIRNIAVGVSAQTGTGFFPSLVQSLAALLDADYALVGLLDENNRHAVTTIALCAHGEIVENISYSLDHTPCAEVIGHRTCIHACGVRQLYPQDRLLADMCVEGYIGTPLFDAQGAPIGLVVVLSRRPLEHLEQAREILEIFAARTSAEMQRLRAESELEAQRAQLEIRVRERTAELAAANQELEAFSYSVSHDLRAPLRAIDGYSQVLIEDFGNTLSSEAKTYLARISQGAQRMGELIDDLLELARVTRIPLQSNPTDLSALAAYTVRQLREGEPGRAVTVIVAPGLTALADRRLISIVLDNLMGNAWKYTGRTEHARIEFGAEVQNGETVFFVKDNGAGFDMQYASKLFIPFQRLHKTDDFPGNGVGLATVARIIRRHGGRIWSHGELEKGAAFFFTV